MHTAGWEEVARAIKELTERVIRLEDLPEESRREVAEGMEELSGQATLPAAEQSSGVIKAVLAHIPQVLSGSAAASQLWQTYGSTIARFFGL